MKNIISILMISVASAFASDNMDYPVEIPTDKDTLHMGVSLVVEGSGYAYGDYDSYVYSEGAKLPLTVKASSDTRQGIKLELHSSKVTIRAAYYDDQLKNSVQRFKNGTTKEDFLRKEDLAKFLMLSIGTKSYDVYFQRDFSRYGTYKIGDEEEKPFTMSSMRVGVKASEKTKLGSFGAYLEGTRSRNLRVLRIGQINEVGDAETIQTLGPFNKTVNGVMGGFFKNPDPSGKLYLTSTASMGIGVTESPLEGLTDIGIPGYYLYHEGYDLTAEFSGSAIMGLNMQFGSMKVRLSTELFLKTAFTAPASNVYPVGVSPDNIPKNETEDDYNNRFSEEYALVDVIYGASAQIKVLF